jgi:AraC family transcriptional regulator, transcriptional activator of the genes for pyochelin and ferripyochelin receptors
MEFKLIAPASENLDIISTLPADFKGYVLPQQTATHVQADFGNILYQHYSDEGFEIWYSNYEILLETVLMGRPKSPFLELHIQYSNELLDNWDGSREKLTRSYQYNFTYAPFEINKIRIPAKTLYSTFDIRFQLNFLVELAPSYPLLEALVDTVAEGKPVETFKIDRFLSPSMVQLVQQMLDCPYKEEGAKFFMRAKVIELLLMVLEDCSEASPLGPVRLSSNDIDMLMQVKALVQEGIDAPLTLQELARKVGINEFKLKKGFKHLFGTTIYDYLTSLRMEKAKQMLLETELRFDEISELVGFAERASFDKAFKKHFSYTPAYLRKYKELKLTT